MKSYSVVCCQCSKPFDATDRKIRKYCSRKCADLSKRGKPSWNKGGVGTMLGKHHTEEVKLKIREANINKRHNISDASRELMREAHVGKPTWNKGLRHSEEHRRNLSLAAVGRLGKKCLNGCTCPKHSIPKCVPNCVCKKHTAPRLRWDLTAQGEHPRPKRCAVTISKPEKKLTAFIEKHALPFKFVGDRKFWIEKVNPDFVNVNGVKIIIQLNGCYYHGCRIHCKSMLYKRHIDAKRLRVCRKYGWRVIRIWQHTLNLPDWESRVMKHLQVSA